MLDQAGMRLDLGGIGKGYAADAALAALADLGIRRALVAASGDLAIGDPPPGRRGWSVGIDAPERRRGRLHARAGPLQRGRFHFRRLASRTSRPAA